MDRAERITQFVGTGAGGFAAAVSFITRGMEANACRSLAEMAISSPTAKDLVRNCQESLGNPPYLAFLGFALICISVFGPSIFNKLTPKYNPSNPPYHDGAYN